MNVGVSLPQATPIAARTELQRNIRFPRVLIFGSTKLDVGTEHAPEIPPGLTTIAGREDPMPGPFLHPAPPHPPAKMGLAFQPGRARTLTGWSQRYQKRPRAAMAAMAAAQAQLRRSVSANLTGSSCMFPRWARNQTRLIQ
jgi:hypothetical protein